jgi:hypothetical protein
MSRPIFRVPFKDAPKAGWAIRVVSSEIGNVKPGYWVSKWEPSIRKDADSELEFAPDDRALFDSEGYASAVSEAINTNMKAKTEVFKV